MYRFIALVTLAAGALLTGSIAARSSVQAARLVLTAEVFTQQDRDEFAARRAQVFDRIGKGVAIILADEAHIHAIRFHQSPDFYYLTGIEEPGAVLVMSGAKRQAFVFARKRSPGQVKVEGPGLLEIPNAAATYGLTQTSSIETLLGHLGTVTREADKLFLQISPADSLQMARDEIEPAELPFVQHPLYRFIPLRKQVVARVHELYPQLTVENIGPILDGLRWVKSPYEIQRLRRSGEIGVEGIREGIRGTKPGMFEYEIEAATEYVHRRMGARNAFTLIVASGPNTVTWHYDSNNRKMESGEVVLMDTGANYAYYSSDITRTWPVSGRFTEEQEKMYRCVMDARQAIIAAIKPGVTIRQLQDAAEEAYSRHGFRQEFLNLGRYVGHFVGLSVHDVNPPGKPQPFKAGVVFNVEPILEMPERKIHFRLEDTILVTAHGADNLTAGAPVEPDELYALIRERGVNSAVQPKGK